MLGHNKGKSDQSSNRGSEFGSEAREASNVKIRRWTLPGIAQEDREPAQLVRALDALLVHFNL